jgi:hypothetical protein
VSSALLHLPTHPHTTNIQQQQASTNNNHPSATSFPQTFHNTTITTNITRSATMPTFGKVVKTFFSALLCIYHPKDNGDEEWAYGSSATRSRQAKAYWDQHPETYRESSYLNF